MEKVETVQVVKDVEDVEDVVEAEETHIKNLSNGAREKHTVTSFICLASVITLAQIWNQY